MARLCTTCSIAFFTAWSDTHTHTHASTASRPSSVGRADLFCKSSSVIRTNMTAETPAALFFFFFVPHPSSSSPHPLCLLSLMASVRRFGSCSSCQLRSSRLNGSGRSRKCRSVVPEWLLGSRIKAQGEDGGVWRRETGAATPKADAQAGGLLYVGAFRLTKNKRFV